MKVFHHLKYFFVLFFLSIFTFFNPSKISAQGTPNLEFVTSMFTSARDVELSGNNAFVSYTNGIAILDITDPTYLLLSGNFNADGCIYYFLDILGNTLYSTQKWDGRIACMRDGLKMYNSLHVIDVTNKALPVEIGSVGLSGPGAGTETDQSGVYNFFTNAQGGLVIINVTDPANPEIINTFMGDSSIFYDVKIVGSTAYLCDTTGKLWTLDVTDPTNLHTLSSETVPGARSVDVVGNYAYVASGTEGLKIVDIRNPVNPNIVGSIDWKSEVPSDSDVLDVDVDGNYAYIANGRMGVFVVDVSDPGSPVEVARYDLDGYTTRIKYGNGHIFTTDTYKGFNVLKFENIPNVTPTITGTQLSVPLFKQNDPLWGSQTYDSAGSNPLFCGSTIGQCGCALSSIAMILKYHGVDKDPDGNPTTPETVNKFFLRDMKCDYKGCTSLGYAYGSVVWTAAGGYSEKANAKFGSQKIVFKEAANYSPENNKAQLANNRPVIIEVPGPQHWVVVTSSVSNTFGINDPGFDRIKLDDPAYGNIALASRFYEKTASDFSSFEVTSVSPAQVLITDKQGRKTGFNKETNSIVKEIPNSYYDFEGSYGDATGVNTPPPAGSGIYSALVLTPEQNDFNVQIIGDPNEDYSFSVHASDKDAGTDLNIFSGVIPSSGSTNYTFGYSPDPSVQEKFAQEVKIDIWPFVGLNKIFRRIKLPTPVGILSSNTFNAPKDLDKKSLTFGKTGNEKSLLECAKFYVDLNRDKLKDVYCLFSTQKAGFMNGDTVGILKGKAQNELDVIGKDKVVIY